jgi:hypothetical protein
MAQDVNKRTRLIMAAMLGSVLVMPCQAGSKDGGTAGGSVHIKCWHNKDGVRECGNVVPPEYAQQGSEIKDRFGVTVGETGRAKTLEELEAERAANKTHELEAEAAKKREAQDRVLLDTFTTEDDMVLTRDGQIAHLESQIHLVESHIDKLQKNLDQMIERAAETERRGEKPADEVVKNIDNVRNQLTDNHKFIETKRNEQDVIRARFATDIARFRELKGIKAPPAASAVAGTATAAPAAAVASPAANAPATAATPPVTSK